MAPGFLSPVHIAMLLVIVVMLFGARRLPELGRSLGTGLRDFRQSLEDKPERTLQEAGHPDHPRPSQSNQAGT